MISKTIDQISSNPGVVQNHTDSTHVAANFRTWNPCPQSPVGPTAGNVWAGKYAK